MENKQAENSCAPQNCTGVQGDKKVLVQICTGTSCFIMGGADLLLLEEVLPARLRNCVMVEGVPCTGQCRAAGQLWAQRPPFLTIDGKAYSGLTLSELIEILQKLLEGSAVSEDDSNTSAGVEEIRGAFSC